jgi:hypothetical protein
MAAAVCYSMQEPCGYMHDNFRTLAFLRAARAQGTRELCRFQSTKGEEFYDKNKRKKNSLSSARSAAAAAQCTCDSERRVRKT